MVVGSLADADSARPGPWANFVNDEQLSDRAFDSFKRSKAFKDFVEVQMPVVLADRWHERVDMALVIEAHGEVIQNYITRFPPRSGSKQEKYLNTYLNLIEKCPDPYFYLAVVGALTEEAYCLQRPGLTTEQFGYFRKGSFSLGGLYLLRPSFILRHLLPRSFRSH